MRPSRAAGAHPSPSRLSPSESEPRRPRRAGVLRRAVATALLLLTGALLAGLAPGAAQAQDRLLVGNLGQPQFGGVAVRQGAGTSPRLQAAQRFLTGDNATGYTLSSVAFQVAAGGYDLRVELWSATGASFDTPGSRLVTLTRPSIGTGAKTYTVPADCSNCTLAANTRYFVVFTEHGGGATASNVRVAFQTAQDGGSLSGWGIANVFHEKSGTGDWARNNTGVIKIAVRGTVNAAPPGKVTGVTVDQVTHNSVRVSWAKPSEHGAAVTSYGVYTRTRNAADTGWIVDSGQGGTTDEDGWIWRANPGASATSHVLTGLPSDVRQQVRIFARAARSGEDTLYGADSDFVEFTTSAVSTQMPMSAPTVESDWALIPSGINVGDSFRLLFLTSTTRDATSTNIADYNSFVQARANAGHTAIRSFGGQFRALASTQADDARDNTATTGTGVPIYWLNGAKAADNYADFYDGSWDTANAARNELGARNTATRAYTGSSAHGTANNAYMGHSACVGRGWPNLTANTISSSCVAPSTTSPLYGLSPVITVQAATDNTAPTLSTATPPSVNGAALTLTYDEALGTGSTPAASAFTVTVAGAARTVSSVSVAGSAVTLTLSPAVNAGEAVTVAYDKPSSNPIQDEAGNEAATFAAQTATNATPGILLSLTSLTVAEGGSGTYTVRLASAPTGNVTVTVARASGSTDVTFDTNAGTGGDQDTLTFTTTNWSTAQTVTVSAAEDTDVADDTATLRHSASGGGYGSYSADLFVTVTDDNAATIAVTHNFVEHIDNDGAVTGSAVFTLSGGTFVANPVFGNASGSVFNCTQLPAGLVPSFGRTSDTVITVTLTGRATSHDTDYTLVLCSALDEALATGAFSGGNWLHTNIPIDFFTSPPADPPTAEAGEDRTVEAGAAVTLSGSATDPNTAIGDTLTYSWAQTGGTPTVTLTGADTATPSFTAPSQAATLVFTLTVTDSTGETDTDTVTVTVSDTTAPMPMTPMPATLVSNLGQSADTSEFGTYTVSSPNQFLDYEVAQAFTTGDHAQGYTLSSVTVELVSADSGVRPVVGIYTVSSDIPGTLVHTLTNPATLSSGQRTWTAPANAALDPNTSYFVRFGTAGGGTEEYQLRGTASNNEDAGKASEWSIADQRRQTSGGGIWGTETRPLKIGVSGTSRAATDSTAPTLSTATVDGTTLTLTYDEALGTGSVPAVGAFTVTVAGAARTVSGVSVSGSTVVLTLSSAVTASDAVTVAYTVPTGGGANPIQDAAGNDAATFAAQTITNATPGILLSRTALTVAEGGSGTYTVRLNTQPSGNVTVTVARASSGSTDVTFDTDADTENDHDTLTFTTANWSTAQAVTVSAMEDDDTDADTATLRHTASGGGYDAHTASLAVTVTDDAAAPVVTVSASATSIEEGAAVTITFTATPAPEDDLDVFYSIEDGRAFGLPTREEDVTITGGETSTTAVLQTLPDEVGDTSTSFTVELADATAELDGYTLGDTASVEVSVTQSTAPVVTVAATPATITEGDVITVTFTADEAAPSGGLAVKYAVTGGTVFGLPVAQVQQTATIAAGQTTATVALDTDPDDEATGLDRTVTFDIDNSVSATGAAYLVGTPGIVSVTVQQDTAAPAFVSASVSGASLTLTYNEALDTGSTPPAGAFTVEVADAARAVSGVAISGSTVTLTLASAVTAGQTVTVAYDAPSTHPIQDEAGNDAADLSETMVTDTGPRIVYVGSFAEAANDGSVTGSVTATLSGDTYAPASSGTTAAGVTASNVPDGLTAVLTRTSDTVVTLTLTGAATNHANTNDVNNLTITFTDAAFANETVATVSGSSKSDIAIDFRNASSITYDGSFREKAANNGAVDGSVTATLSGDTFTADVVSGGHVTVSNAPDGLTAVLTRTSDTVVTLTLGGRATSHALSDSIDDLTIAFADGAFTNDAAATVVGSTKSDIAVDFTDIRIAYAGTLSETTANNGAVGGSITATLSGDTFMADVVSGNHVSADNVPDGLTASFARTSATVVTLTLTGTATSHGSADSISNLTIRFTDDAFTNATAAAVLGSTRNNFRVDFTDASSIVYAGSFTETAANNGAVDGSVTATLSGDTFTADVVSGDHVSASNVPDGLTASFARTSDTVVTLTLTGTATNHADANDIANLTVTFADGAFTNETAAAVLGSTRNNFRVDFTDASSIVYAGSFTETAANDGSVTGSVTATLTGDTFAAGTGAGGTTAAGVTASNVPAGLTAVLTRTSDTVVTLTLTGSASAHANANDVSDLTITFTDAAFTNETAATVSGTSKSNIGIDFTDASSIVYTGSFTEAAANDGSVTGSVTATLTGDTFAAGTGAGGTTAAGVTASNVPAGLTAVLTRTSDTVVTLTLTGSASAHANADDVSNLTITFTDTAFVNEAASRVGGATRNDIAIDFTDPSTIIWAGSFAETAANNGDVAGSVTATLAGDTFTAGVAMGNNVTVTNLPEGLTAAYALNGARTEFTLTLTGTASSHADANDVTNLTVTFADGAFTNETAATVGNSSKNDLAIGFNDNNAPVFTAGATATFSVAENTAAGQNIGTALAATDTDGHTLTWTLGGTDAASFAIVPASGQLQTSAALDFETDSSHSVTVTVSDGQGGSDSIDVMINVTDVNEPPAAPAAPTFGATTATTVVVNWLAPANTGPAITGYELQYRQGTTGDFMPHAHTGTTRTTMLTGLTPGASYQVQVRATNAEGTGGWSASGTVDAGANTAPAFGATSYSFDLAENADGSTTPVAVGTVSATDSDPGHTVEYSITAGNTGGVFAIDSSSGAITYTGGGEDHETTPSFTFTVQATDGIATPTVTVTVTVTDDDTEAPAAPAAPTFGATTATTAVVDWLTPDNAGPPITDYDVQYRTGTGAWSDPDFTGTATTTTLTGLTPGASYEVQVRATNAEGTGAWSSSGTVTASANNPPTFGAASYSFDLAENANGSTTPVAVGTVSATDTDPGHTPNFSIAAGDTGGVFTIDSAGGAITYTGSGEDHETTPSFILTVRATDSAGGTATVTVTVNVTDVNEPPVFADTTTAFDVAENTRLVLVLGATDPDAGDTDVTYSLSGMDEALFRVTASGRLRFHSAPDFEAPGCGAGNTCTVTVTASAGAGGRAKTATRDITVTVTDANEAPAFAAGTPASFSVAENTADVGTVTAADPDATDAAVTYALTGTDAGLLSVTSGGVISFRAAPDFENPRGGADNDSNDYTFTVEATAGAGGREMTAIHTLTVTVTDVTETATLTIAGLADGTVAENAAYAATPAVTGAIGAVTWTKGGADADAFTIDASTGALAMVARDFEAPADADADNAYELTVTATDADGNTTAMSIVVTVTDVLEGSDPPTVRAVSISSPASGGTFRHGESIVVEVSWTSRLTVTGRPRLALTVGTNTRHATFSSVLNDIPGLGIVSFTYTVQLGDHDADGISVTGPVDLNGGTIQGRDDRDGDAVRDLRSHAIDNSAGHEVDGRSSVTQVAISSSPASGDTYRAGENIEVGVTLNAVAHVDRARGTPQLALTIGGATRQAAYASRDSFVSGTSILTFAYTVRAGDSDTDGISVPAGAVDLNGGVLRDAATGGNTLALALAYNAVAADSGHKVDGGPALPVPLAPDLSGVLAAVSGRTLGFNWESQAADAARAAVTGYRVEWSADGNAPWTAIMPNLGAPETPGTSRIIFSEADVPCGTTRHYRVFALSESGDSPASATISGTVAAGDGCTPAPRANAAPAFADRDSTTRSVAENTPAGRNIGAPLAASDADGDTLTWTLGGTDAAAFAIVPASGQLRTRAPLDFETRTSYSLTVTVSDGNGGSDSIDVTVTVTDVDETAPPPPPPPPATNNAPAAEAGPPQTVDPAAAVTLSGSGTDPDGDALTYAWAQVSGADVPLSGSAAARAAFTAPVAPGALVFRLTVRDPGGLTASDEVTVTVRDLVPDFGGAAVAALGLTAGAAIEPLVLPEATGGNGALTYVLSSDPAGLAGLSFDPATRTLSGTPSAGGTYAFAYRADDADANQADAAVLSFRVTVASVLTGAEAAVTQVLQRTLAAVGTRTLTAALGNIGARFADVAGTGLTLAGYSMPLGTGGASAGGLAAGGTDGSCVALGGDLEQAGFRGGDEACGGVSSWGVGSGELFRSSAFTLRLGAAPGESSADPTAAQWALWGRGDVGSFAGSPEPGMRYEGESRTAWLGFDGRAGPWVAGVALSRGESEAAYALDGGPGADGSGRLETTLTAFYPYGRWTRADGLELRGVLGVGTGEARNVPGGGAAETSGLEMRMASLGLRRELPALVGIDLAARADASLVQLETGSGPDTISGVSADSWRARVGLEASRHIALGGEAALVPFVEAAGRRDGGDGVTGSGLEVAGGVRYSAPGVEVEARGRWLAAHTEAGARERGVSVTARVGPGAEGRGLSLSLSPRWGAGTGAAEALWRDEMPRAAGAVAETGSIDAQLGYGIVLAPGNLLTPFAETGLAGDGYRHLRLGTRFDTRHADLALELSGERRESGIAVPEHALRLDLRLGF